MSTHALPGSLEAPTVLFVAFQTDALANGGLESFAQIVERVPLAGRTVVTNRLSELTRRLERGGCEVCIVETHRPPANGAGRVARLGARLRGAPNLTGANAEVARLVRRTGAQVVHCNDISAFWHAAPGAKVAGAQVIFNVRDMFPPERPYGLKWSAALALADRVLVLSEEMRVELDARVPNLGWRRAPSHIEAIHSIVDLDRMQPPSAERRAALRGELGVGDTDVLVVHVGGFCEKKGQLELLRRAAPQILSDGRAHLVFAGDFSPDRNSYARACEAARLQLGAASERVRFVGYSANVADVYGAADVLVLTSLYEGLPRAVIEAMACGTPIAAFAVCSVREVVEANEAGLVVPTCDWNGLVASVLDLVADPSRRVTMARAGRVAAERLFLPARQVELHARLYHRLASR